MLSVTYTSIRLFLGRAFQLVLIGLYICGMGMDVFAQTDVDKQRMKETIQVMLPEGDMAADIVGGGTVQFSIGSDGQTFWFYTYNDPPEMAQVLDRISVHLEDQIVTVDSVTLTFTGEVNVTDDKNDFGSTWKGYRWSFQSPADNGLRYDFTLGTIERTGQTLLHINASEIQLPLLF